MLGFRHNGAWYRALPQLRHNGVWYPLVVWQREGGVWYVAGGLYDLTVNIGRVTPAGGTTLTGFSAAGTAYGVVGGLSRTYFAHVNESLPIARLLHTTSSGGRFMFALGAPNVPNTDATFSRIVFNGRTYLRSAATYTANYVPYNETEWSWREFSPPFPSGNSTSLQIYVG